MYPVYTTNMIECTQMETVRYTYALRVSKTSKLALNTEWDRARWIWNQCVGRDIDMRNEGENIPSGYGLAKELTDWRGRYEWLRNGSQNVQQNTVLSWAKNRQMVFKIKGRRKPKFKSKQTSLPTLEYTTNGFSLKDNRLVVAGKISLVIIYHRPLPSVPKSVTVYRDATGKWWASFVVQRELEQWAPTTGKIGIDWGVKDIAITTNPKYDLPSRNYCKNKQTQLTKIQQKMARRRRPKDTPKSRGYIQAQAQFAKLHAQIARQRKHDARQWARQIVADHDVIAIEDFKPKFLAKSTMARKSADNSVEMVKSELIKYCVQAGRQHVLVNPAWTTQTCSECDARTKRRLTLSDRIFCCVACGFVADRDRNAAKVILVKAEMILRNVENVSQLNSCSLVAV
jgi:putative transposase